jgi:hypothetical protein
MRRVVHVGILGLAVAWIGCGGPPQATGPGWDPDAATDDGDDGDAGDDDAGETDGGGASADGDRPDGGDTNEPPGDDGHGDDNGTTGEPPASNCWDEPLDPDGDVSAILSSYGGADYKQDLVAAMAVRWPAGAYLLGAQIDDPYFSQFSDSSSWPGMVNWLDTLVHEQTHLFNAYHAIDVGEHAALYFTEDVILYMPPEQGFARAEIMSELAPGAAAGIYAGTYLVGSQGERGFNAVLDEATCYLNEVPGLAVFGDDYPGQGVSLRDGIAAFTYFLEVYLRVARTEHAEFYAWAIDFQVHRGDQRLRRPYRRGPQGPRQKGRPQTRAGP